MSDEPFDHNGECRYCDELGMHRADCPWLLKVLAENKRLQEHLQWAKEEAERRGDEIMRRLAIETVLREEIDSLRKEIDRER